MTKKIKYGLILIISFISLMFLLLVMNSPKELTISDSTYNLQQIPDGSYAGNCDNGLVKVQLIVIIKNHAIVDIQILQHDNGLGGKAEAITQDVIKYQSLEVDTIAQATISSETILKAIENALSKGYTQNEYCHYL